MCAWLSEIGEVVVCSQMNFLTMEKGKIITFYDAAGNFIASRPCSEVFGEAVEIPMKRKKPVAAPLVSLEELRCKICDAISRGSKDLSIIDGEDMEDYSKFWRVSGNVFGRHPYCNANRRSAIGSMYFDYCLGHIYPFCSEEERRKKILDAINEYFCD